MPSEAFLIQDGKEFGPFTPTQLKQLADAGRIRPDDFIRKGKDGKPIPARKIAGLIDAFGGAAKPSLPQPNAAWLNDVLSDAGEDEADQPARLPPRAEKTKSNSDPSWMTTERVPPGFDPYHIWLGIPKGKRPPTHYQLLRIGSSEHADEVIEASAERQAEYVRKCRIGEYATFADRLLYEIEEARLCLLNPQLRKEYDEKLAEGKPTPTKKRVLPPPGRPVGEGNEIATTYFKIVSILTAAFILTAVVSFMLPWKRVVFSKSKEDAEIANVAALPAAPQAAAPIAANVPQVPPPAQKIVNALKKLGPASKAEKPVQPQALAAKGVPPVLDREEMRLNEQVRDAIRRSQKFLVGVQKDDGSFGGLGFENPRRTLYATGMTSLALFSMLKSGMGRDDPAIAKGLQFLRTTPLPDSTYEVSTMLLALVLAHDWERDRTQIEHLAQKLTNYQTTKGPKTGMWNYGHGKLGGGQEDNCNTGFAIASLHAATEAGVRIQRRTWQLTAEHLTGSQNDDGGWGYHNGDRSTGSMTCSAIASLLNCSQHLASPKIDGTLQSSDKGAVERDRAVKRGIDWLGQHFTVDENPGHGTSWVLFYLFEVARAGRLSGQQFFGPHDWYREGAGHLIDVQDRGKGNWNATFARDSNVADKIVATSFGLLVLSEHGWNKPMVAENVSSIHIAQPMPNADVTPPASQPEKQSEPGVVFRSFEIAIDENGVCNLTVDSRKAESDSPNDKGDVIEPGSDDKPQVVRLRNGDRHIDYDFTRLRSVEALIPQKLPDKSLQARMRGQLLIDKDAGAFQLSPVRANGRLAFDLASPMNTQFPFKIKIEFARFDQGRFNIPIMMSGSCFCVALDQRYQGDEIGVVHVDWRQNRGGNNSPVYLEQPQGWQSLLKYVQDKEKVTKHQFRIPPASLRKMGRQKQVAIFFGILGDQPILIRRVALTGTSLREAFSESK